MTALSHGAVLWAGAMARACWQGGLALAAAALLCRLWARLSPPTRCWLWRLAALKLLVALLGAPAINLPVLPARGVQAARMNTEARRHGERDTEVPPPLRAALARLGLLLWLVGVGSYAIGFGREARASRRRRTACRPLQDPELAAACRELCRRLRVRRAPRLLVAPGGGSPWLEGSVGPAIIFPRALLDACSRRELRLMLAHELAHLKRRDLQWGWLATAAHGLFFFHPLLWLAGEEWRLAQEMACDEMAMAITQAPADEYGGALLKVAAQRPPALSWGPLAVGVLESYHTLKRRLMRMKSIEGAAAGRREASLFALTAFGLLGLVPWRVVAQEPSRSHPSPRAAAVREAAPLRRLTSPPVRETHGQSSRRLIAVIRRPAGLVIPSTRQGPRSLRTRWRTGVSESPGREGRSAGEAVPVSEEASQRSPATARFASRLLGVARSGPAATAPLHPRPDWGGTADAVSAGVGKKEEEFVLLAEAPQDGPASGYRLVLRDAAPLPAVRARRPDGVLSPSARPDQTPARSAARRPGDSAVPGQFPANRAAARAAAGPFSGQFPADVAAGRGLASTPPGQFHTDLPSGQWRADMPAGRLPADLPSPSRQLSARPTGPGRWPAQKAGATLLDVLPSDNSSAVALSLPTENGRVRLPDSLPTRKAGKGRPGALPAAKAAAGVPDSLPGTAAVREEPVGLPGAAGAGRAPLALPGDAAAGWAPLASPGVAGRSAPATGIGAAERPRAGSAARPESPGAVIGTPAALPAGVEEAPAAMPVSGAQSPETAARRRGLTVPAAPWPGGTPVTPGAGTGATGTPQAEDVPLRLDSGFTAAPAPERAPRSFAPAGGAPAPRWETVPREALPPGASPGAAPVWVAPEALPAGERARLEQETGRMGNVLIDARSGRVMLVLRSVKSGRLPTAGAAPAGR